MDLIIDAGGGGRAGRAQLCSAQVKGRAQESSEFCVWAASCLFPCSMVQHRRPMPCSGVEAEGG